MPGRWRGRVEASMPGRWRVESKSNLADGPKSVRLFGRAQYESAAGSCRSYCGVDAPPTPVGMVGETKLTGGREAPPTTRMEKGGGSPQERGHAGHPEGC